MGNKGTEESAAGGGYVKVHSVPYTYDHGAEADGEYPKRVPLLRCFNHQEPRIDIDIDIDTDINDSIA